MALTHHSLCMTTQYKYNFVIMLFCCLLVSNLCAVLSYLNSFCAKYDQSEFSLEFPYVILFWYPDQQVYTLCPYLIWFLFTHLCYHYKLFLLNHFFIHFNVTGYVIKFWEFIGVFTTNSVCYCYFYFCNCDDFPSVFR